MTCPCDICGYTNEVQEVGNKVICDWCLEAGGGDDGKY